MVVSLAPHFAAKAAQLIEDLKKANMAREAKRLLDGTGWLPEPLRLRVADASGVA
jgi:ParB family chromosome partitioning protein